MSSPTDEHRHPDERQQEPAQGQGDHHDPISELYKYLLLLGILVATVTCTAGLDPPGGLWQQESKDDGHRTDDPIMLDTRRARYIVFCVSNSSAFVVSLVLVVYLLLSAPRNRGRRRRVVLKVVVVVDLILLVVAFVAGSCRSDLITIYASVHCGAVAIIVPILVILANKLTKNHDEVLCEESRKVLMLFAIFAVTVTYTASLTPPGGFWEHAPAGSGNPKLRAGDPILLERDLGRMVVFFVGNTTAFITSVVIMILLLFLRLTNKIFRPFCACIMLVMLGLVAAYTASSVWRHPKTTTDTVIIITFLVGDIFLYYVFHLGFRPNKTRRSSAADRKDGQAAGGASPPEEEASSSAAAGPTGTVVPSSPQEDIARDLILLLATMVATVTYQAGLQPPGGVWQGTGQGHSGGGLILLVTHAAQYKAFFFFNTAAFVTSLVVVIMVQKRPLVGQHALEAAVILDLLGLLGAYAAGTIRGHHAWSSACVFILAAAIFVFLFLVATLLHQKLQAPPPVVEAHDRIKETRREVLMLLATMAITITYQAGLTPPGKFWLEGGGHGAGGHHAGDPVLVDTYPHLYEWFVFSNTATFMISVAVILFLVSRNLHSVSKIWWCVLSAYTLLVLVLLMTTFIAGANRRLPRATFTAILIAFTLIFQAGTLLIAFCKNNDVVFTNESGWFRVKAAAAAADDTRRQASPHRRGASAREYLMGVSILAASVAYQAGLSPPGGSWPDDGHGHAAGNPVLYDTNKRRYLAFYYCNMASFAASIAVNVLLLLDVLVPEQRFFPRSVRATYMVLVLDLLGLLMAYATGSSRDKDTWMYVLAMATAMLAYIVIYKMVLPRGNRSSGTQGGQRPSEQTPA